MFVKEQIKSSPLWVANRQGNASRGLVWEGLTNGESKIANAGGTTE
jgi:hypothetical protein